MGEIDVCSENIHKWSAYGVIEATRYRGVAVLQVWNRTRPRIICWSQIRQASHKEAVSSPQPKKTTRSTLTQERYLKSDFL